MTHYCPPPSRELLCGWTDCAPNPAARSRRALHIALVLWGLATETINDAVLATSELVANATEHAIGPYELWLCRTGARLICEVHDHDPRIPELPAFPSTAPFLPDPQSRGGGLEALCFLLSERGRGLQIVDHLSKGCWGFDLLDDGKKVAWVAFPVELTEKDYEMRR